MSETMLTAITSQVTAIQGTIEKVAPAAFPILGIMIGISVAIKLIKKVAK